jgi:hypothetical protein
LRFHAWAALDTTVRSGEGNCTGWNIPWLETGSRANQQYIKYRTEAIRHGTVRNKFLQNILLIGPRARLQPGNILRWWNRLGCGTVLATLGFFGHSNRETSLSKESVPSSLADVVRMTPSPAPGKTKGIDWAAALFSRPLVSLFLEPDLVFPGAGDGVIRQGSREQCRSPVDSTTAKYSLAGDGLAGQSTIYKIIDWAAALFSRPLVSLFLEPDLVFPGAGDGVIRTTLPGRSIMGNGAVIVTAKPA